MIHRAGYMTRPGKATETEWTHEVPHPDINHHLLLLIKQNPMARDGERTIKATEVASNGERKGKLTLRTAYVFTPSPRVP